MSAVQYQCSDREWTMQSILLSREEVARRARQLYGEHLEFVGAIAFRRKISASHRSIRSRNEVARTAR